MTFFSRASLHFWIACFILIIAVAPAPAAKPPALPVPNILDTAPGSRELSPADCAVFINNEPAKSVKGTVEAAVNPGDKAVWSAGGADGATVFTYRIAFAKAVSIGTVITQSTAQKIAVLKPDAPFPGDPKIADHWIFADIPPRQSARSLAALPAVISSRAILLIDKRDHGTSEIRSIEFSPRRLFNATPLAQAYGDAEYTFYPFMGSPVTYSAQSLVQGYGYWQNHGPSKENRITTPDVSDINPSWFIMSWDERQTISALWMRDNFEKFEVDVFVGSDTLNPRAGTDAEWKRIRPTAAASIPEPDPRQGGGHLLMFSPVATRGIRFRITQTSEPTIAAKLTAVHTLIDLNDKPRPETPASAAEISPMQVKYTTEFDGEVSIVINSPDGTRVRNLVSRAFRKKGEQSEPWDLKDQNGNLVPAGKYQWQVLMHPPLELKYEMTPYPNVQNFFPDSAPWPTGASGGGGWATNHTPPSSVAVVGDNLYVGSYVSEGGSALLEANLEGKKSWGTGNFAAWTGPQFLAGEGNSLYVQARVLGEDKDNIYVVDRTTKRITNPISLRPTGTRDRRVVGMAAYDGKIMLSSYAIPNWFDIAPQASDVDFLASWPKLPEKRKERVPHEIVPDPRGDWLRLFRLTGTPPGQKDGDGFLIAIESTHGAGARQYAVLAFKRPIPIGSVIFPQPTDKKIEIRVSVLKPDAPYPPNPGDPKIWVPFETQAKQSWDVATAAPGAVTRALRIAFVKGGDDLFTDGDESSSFIADEKSMPDDSKKSAIPGTSDNWHGRLDGMKILRRRFANVAGSAAVKVSSGTVAADGVWDARRKEPLSLENPGVYMMEWKTAQKLRGLAFKEIDGKQTQIDVFTGPENAPITLDGDGWEKVASYEQIRRKHHWGGGNLTEMYARYTDGYVDFGKEITTRAVRLRVVEQWAENGSNPQYGMRPDLGGITLDMTRCRIFGVAALQYLGGEDPVDPLMNERIETFNAKSGELVSEIPIDKPGQIAVDPKGQLFAVTQKQIVRVDEKGKHVPVVTDVVKPQALAVDSASNLYVYDAGPRQNIRVYDASGKYLRSIGEEGKREVGPWNPLRMHNVTSIAVDKLGQVWATEANFWPKRVVQWGADGKFIKELLGPTEYGGGGTLDPWDKTRFFYGSLEFALDWKTGKTSLKNWYLDDKMHADQPIHIGERTYLVNRPQGSLSQTDPGVVYLLEKGKARLVAAMGGSEKFPLLASPAARKAVGRPILKGTRFVWSDLNGDEQIQSDEIKITDMPGERPYTSIANFGDDLSTQSGSLRYQVTKILDNGVPVYSEVPLRLNANNVFSGAGTYKLDNGNFISLGSNGYQSAVTAEGKVVWTYRTEGCGVHALYSAGPWTPQQVVSEFSWVGHETAPTGDLGEFLVTTSNVGTWNIWTADGFLAGQIFRDQRDPRREAWSMSECERGLLLKDVTVGQEHFQGYFCRSKSDNKFYVVAGHIHGSIVEVIGLDRFKRAKGELEVTPKLLVDTSAWDRAREKRAVYQRAPVIDCYRLKSVPILNDPADWGFTSAELDDNLKFSMGYTDTDLYVRYYVRDLGPMKNSGDQWDKLFKTGASVDLQMGVDPAIADDRKTPEAGDFRLLMTIANGKPAAVLYQPVVPGTPEDKAWKVVSPVAQISIDKVTQITNVQMAAKDVGEDGVQAYVFQAAIPLSLIGLKPAPGLRLRMDWGVLASGKDGREVLRRIYWANKATAIVSDAPSEAALFPNLWGHVRFFGLPGTTGAPASPLNNKHHDATNKQVDELLDDIDNDKK